MKKSKSKWAVLLGVSGLVGLIVTYLISFWYLDQDPRMVFIVVFFCTAMVILLGRQFGGRKV